MRKHRPAIAISGASLLIAVFALIYCTAAQATDTRQVISTSAPPWLRAVGKLQVPGQRFEKGHALHYLEDCSATLVALPDRDRADTIVTAWHCLELYKDLSRPILFTLSPSSGVLLNLEAYRLADGGGMHADWAILRLRQSVPADKVDSLQVHPQQADASRPVTMAGYSGDSGMGDNGQRLTFDPECIISQQHQNVGDTNCTAHKGASGGAVIQVSNAGEAYLCGVISQGDGEGRSTFVPVGTFRESLTLYIR